MKRDYDNGKQAEVFMRGWCFAFALAFHRRHPANRIRWVNQPSTHVFCTDGHFAFDSMHLKGTPIAETLEKYFGFPTKGEGHPISEAQLKQQFGQNFPEVKWEETVAFAEAWLAIQNQP